MPQWSLCALRVTMGKSVYPDGWPPWSGTANRSGIERARYRVWGVDWHCFGFPVKRPGAVLRSEMSRCRPGLEPGERAVGGANESPAMPYNRETADRGVLVFCSDPVRLRPNQESKG